MRSRRSMRSWRERGVKRRGEKRTVDLRPRDERRAAVIDANPFAKILPPVGAHLSLLVQAHTMRPRDSAASGVK